MPILPGHAKELESTVCDLKSTGKGKGGGACTAAAFLEAFVEPGVNFAHVDVAGPAMLSSPQAYMPENGSGFGVQAIVQYLEARA